MPTVTPSSEKRAVRNGGLQIHRPKSRRFTSTDLKFVDDDLALKTALEDNSDNASLDDSDSAKKMMRETMVKNALRRNYTR